jgi:hypothetical protein
VGKIRVRPLNGGILIGWSRPLSYTKMLLYLPTDPENPGNPIDMGQQGDYLASGLQNGTTYYVIVQGVVEDPSGAQAMGPLSQPIAVTPKEDPDAPSGAILIEGGAPTTGSTQVVLRISSTDTILNGAAQSANAHQTDRLSRLYNTVSGNVQMRISNSEDLADAEWEPLAQTKQWQLDCAAGEVCLVYAQFRDAALNESLIVNDDIQLVGPQPADVHGIYLPLLDR